jgi:outer membrane protein, heavy metal efflux system
MKKSSCKLHVATARYGYTHRMHPRRTQAARIAAGAILAIGSAWAFDAHAQSAPGAAVANRPAQLNIESFTPTATLALGEVSRLARQRSAATRSDYATAAIAKTDIEQAKLHNNPQLDATWGNLPLIAYGSIANPWLNTPNYGVGVSYQFPIGKRSPAIRRAEALAASAGFTARDTLRHVTLIVARSIAAVGVAQLRVVGLHEEVTDQQDALALTKSRVKAGFGALLEVDRLEIELDRLQQQEAAATADMEASLAACAALLRMPCTPFTDVASVRTFMRRWDEAALLQVPRPDRPASAVELRPDVLALDASGRAANEDLVLARARAIPDPVVRIGVTRDAYFDGGGLPLSAALSVSLPLPIFDSGQAMKTSAALRIAAVRDQRQLLLGHAQERMTTLIDTLNNRTARRNAIESVVLPKAQRVIDSLAKSAAERLIPLNDVIQARRTYAELLLQEADSYSDAFEASLALLEETVLDLNQP